MSRRQPHIIFLILSISTLFLFISGCVATAPQSRGPRPVVPYTFIASSGATTGALSIRSIELKFQNGVGDITLPPNTPPQPEAIIQFDGNGLFQAYWQVDKQDIEPVSVNVTFGKTLKLRFLNVSQIATFPPGQHHVTLRIVNPQTNLAPPIITYFIQKQ